MIHLVFNCLLLTKGFLHLKIRPMRGARVILKLLDTVDGSEILRSPVEVGSVSHYLRRVLAPDQVVSRIPEPSTVLGLHRWTENHTYHCVIQTLLFLLFLLSRCTAHRF